MDHAAFHISKTCKRSGYFNSIKTGLREKCVLPDFFALLGFQAS